MAMKIIFYFLYIAGISEKQCECETPKGSCVRICDLLAPSAVFGIPTRKYIMVDSNDTITAISNGTILDKSFADEKKMLGIKKDYISNGFWSTKNKRRNFKERKSKKKTKDYGSVKNAKTKNSEGEMHNKSNASTNKVVLNKDMKHANQKRKVTINFNITNEGKTSADSKPNIIGSLLFEDNNHGLITKKLGTGATNGNGPVIKNNGIAQRLQKNAEMAFIGRNAYPGNRAMKPCSQTRITGLKMFVQPQIGGTPGFPSVIKALPNKNNVRSNPINSTHSIQLPNGPKNFDFTGWRPTSRILSAPSSNTVIHKVNMPRTSVLLPNTGPESMSINKLTQPPNSRFIVYRGVKYNICEIYKIAKQQRFIMKDSLYDLVLRSMPVSDICPDLFNIDAPNTRGMSTLSIGRENISNEVLTRSLEVNEILQQQNANYHGPNDASTSQTVFSQTSLFGYRQDKLKGSVVLGTQVTATLGMLNGMLPKYDAINATHEGNVVGSKTTDDGLALALKSISMQPQSPVYTEYGSSFMDPLLYPTNEALPDGKTNMYNPASIQNFSIAHPLQLKVPIVTHSKVYQASKMYYDNMETNSFGNGRYSTDTPSVIPPHELHPGILDVSKFDKDVYFDPQNIPINAWIFSGIKRMTPTQSSDHNYMGGDKLFIDYIKNKLDRYSTEHNVPVHTEAIMVPPSKEPANNHKDELNKVSSVTVTKLKIISNTVTITASSTTENGNNSNITIGQVGAYVPEIESTRTVTVVRPRILSVKRSTGLKTVFRKNVQEMEAQEVMHENIEDFITVAALKPHMSNSAVLRKHRRVDKINSHKLMTHATIPDAIFSTFFSFPTGIPHTSTKTLSSIHKSVGRIANITGEHRSKSLGPHYYRKLKKPHADNSRNSRDESADIHQKDDSTTDQDIMENEKISINKQVKVRLPEELDNEANNSIISKFLRKIKHKLHYNGKKGNSSRSSTIYVPTDGMKASSKLRSSSFVSSEQKSGTHDQTTTDDKNSSISYRNIGKDNCKSKVIDQDISRKIISPIVKTSNILSAEPSIRIVLSSFVKAQKTASDAVLTIRTTITINSDDLKPVLLQSILDREALIDKRSTESTAKASLSSTVDLYSFITGPETMNIAATRALKSDSTSTSSVTKPTNSRSRVSYRYSGALRILKNLRHRFAIKPSKNASKIAKSPCKTEHSSATSQVNRLSSVLSTATLEVEGLHVLPELLNSSSLLQNITLSTALFSKSISSSLVSSSSLTSFSSTRDFSEVPIIAPIDFIETLPKKYSRSSNVSLSEIENKTVGRSVQEIQKHTGASDVTLFIPIDTQSSKAINGTEKIRHANNTEGSRTNSISAPHSQGTREHKAEIDKTSLSSDFICSTRYCKSIEPDPVLLLPSISQTVNENGTKQKCIGLEVVFKKYLNKSTRNNDKTSTTVSLATTSSSTEHIGSLRKVSTTIMPTSGIKTSDVVLDARPFSLDVKAMPSATKEISDNTVKCNSRSSNLYGASTSIGNSNSIASLAAKVIQSSGSLGVKLSTELPSNISDTTDGIIPTISTNIVILDLLCSDIRSSTTLDSDSKFLLSNTINHEITTVVIKDLYQPVSLLQSNNTSLQICTPKSTHSKSLVLDSFKILSHPTTSSNSGIKLHTELSSYSKKKPRTVYKTITAYTRKSLKVARTAGSFEEKRCKRINRPAEIVYNIVFKTTEARAIPKYLESRTASNDLVLTVAILAEDSKSSVIKQKKSFEHSNSI